jgi:hypothetical protein
VLGDDWLPVLPVEQSLSHLSDQLTPEARRVMAAADEAEELGHGYLGENLAQLGWSLRPTNRSAAILAAHNLDPGRLRAELSADRGAAL